MRFWKDFATINKLNMIGLVKTHVNKPIKHVELQGLLVNVRHVCVALLGEVLAAYDHALGAI